MANQLDPKMIVTTDSIEGYRIVKYLGPIAGSVNSSWVVFSAKNMPEAFNQQLEPLIKRAEEVGANAIVGMKIVFPTERVGLIQPLFYGTAVIVEPIST
jgi:uncharacterized protein YbjQ (UPF0145 family)